MYDASLIRVLLTSEVGDFRPGFLNFLNKKSCSLQIFFKIITRSSDFKFLISFYFHQKNILLKNRVNNAFVTTMILGPFRAILSNNARWSYNSECFS